MAAPGGNVAASMPAGPAPTTSTSSGLGGRLIARLIVLHVRVDGAGDALAEHNAVQAAQAANAGADVVGALPAAALLQNSASHRLARPIMQMSAAPSSISSSAIQASLMRADGGDGMLTCFLISREKAACEACWVPAAGIAEPRFDSGATRHVDHVDASLSRRRET